jgi:hypothetical protein
MNCITTRRIALAAVIAAATAIGTVTSAANAADLSIERDDVTLIATEAHLSPGGVDWATEIGSEEFHAVPWIGGGTVPGGSVVWSGRLTGQLTFHNPSRPGCARVMTRWQHQYLDNAGYTVLYETANATPDVCSDNALPSLPVNISTSQRGRDLAGVIVELQVRNVRGTYKTTASKTVQPTRRNSHLPVIVQQG